MTDEIDEKLRASLRAEHERIVASQHQHEHDGENIVESSPEHDAHMEEINAISKQERDAQEIDLQKGKDAIKLLSNLHKEFLKVKDVQKELEKL